MEEYNILEFFYVNMFKVNIVNILYYKLTFIKGVRSIQIQYKQSIIIR